jgi:uncharacterized protein (TIGR03083 family)
MGSCIASLGMDTGVLYADTRGRITELVRALSPEQEEATVPATPSWRVRDIVAHLSGNLADILAGNLDGVATDPWTAAQVDARRDKTVEAILDEWAENGPKVEAMLDSFGPAGVQLLADTITHEQDIRGAVGQAGGRDCDAADAALQWLVAIMGDRLAANGAPALRVSAGDQEWTIGPGEPAASVTAPDCFELLRAMIARRSRSQIEGWKWDGDPTPYLDHFAPWPLRDTDLVE